MYVFFVPCLSDANMRDIAPSMDEKQQRDDAALLYKFEKCILRCTSFPRLKLPPTKMDGNT